MLILRVAAYLIAVFPLSVVGCSYAAVDIFVSKNGNNQWSGRLQQPNRDLTDGPLSSLNAARDKVRNIPDIERSGGVNVLVMAGEYELDTEFILGSLDSGKEDARITYKAYSGERVILRGSRRLNECARDSSGIDKCNVRSLKLEALSWVALPVNYSHADAPRFSLFDGPYRLEPARWPNRNVGDRIGGDWGHIQGASSSDNKSFVVSSRLDLARWKVVEGTQVHLFPRWDWRDEIIAVESVDPQSHTIRLARAPQDTLTAGQRFYVQNVAEEMDAAGEWYFDRRNGEVRIKPRSSVAASYSVSVLENIIKLDGVKFVTVTGFHIEHSRGSAILLLSGEGNAIVGNVIRYSGKYGIEMAGVRNSFSDNDVFESGYSGVKVMGGDRVTLISGANRIENNWIQGYGRLIKMIHSPGINVSGVGQIIRKNLVTDGPHMGIYVAGNEHVLELNDIYDVAKECSDCGAVSSFGDWTFRGNVLRNNRIRNIIGYQFKGFQDGKSHFVSPYEYGSAIYLDDAISGWVVEGNVVNRVAQTLLYVHNGRDNLLVNNVLIDDGLDDEWPPLEIGGPVIEANFQRFSFPGLKAVPYSSGDVWQKRYPKLAAPMRNYRWPEGNRAERNLVIAHPGASRDFVAARFKMPSDTNSIRQNLYWNGGRPITMNYQFLNTAKPRAVIGFDVWQDLGMDAGSIFADPKIIFKDGEFAGFGATEILKKIGFERIPVEDIGLVRDFKRPSGLLPVPPSTSRITGENLFYDY